ncbi:hypothetical protein MHU86_22538 [Fragilaria crotonensis]|nr:hypothetical protein MHU86_22538 [Fragilaria crotonensis]
MASQELLETETRWLLSASLDNVVRDHTEFKSIVSINNVGIAQLPVRLLRRFCAKLKVSGYKNLNRDSTIKLIAQRILSHEIEERLYPKAPDDIPTEEEGEGHLPSSHLLQDTTSSILYSASNTSSEEDASPATNTLLLSVAEEPPGAVHVSKSRSDAPGRSSGSKAKKKNTSSPPTSVTQMGTYIRAINVFFDQKHRNDVFSLGATPSMQELDARSDIRVKAVYNRMLVTYLDQSIPHIGAVAFADDPYLPSMGVYDNAALEFDVLTSEELKDTLAFVNRFYKIAHRNNQKSGSHDDFHNFTRDKAYVFYYHLWLQHLPNLLCIAVPSLPPGIATDSTLHPSNSATARRRKDAGSKRKGNASADALAAAILEVGRSSSKKLLVLEEMNALKKVNAIVDRERALLALMGEYDVSLKRKIDDLDGYTSDMEEEKQVARTVIEMIKKKRNEVIKSLETSHHQPPTAG